MPPDTHRPSLNAPHVIAPPGWRVGVDLVSVATVREALAQFDQRYVDRVYTAQEQLDAAARTPPHDADALAARWAAKEAALKALDLCDRGVNLRDIEVHRLPDGAPTLLLHGRAADAARMRGWQPASLSLSHDAGFAIAVVLACPCPASDSTDPTDSPHATSQ